jgi:purine nucleoside phosphorylase
VTSRLALVVGSGLAAADIDIRWRDFVDTRWGRTTSPIGELHTGPAAAFVLARHGREQSLAPHEVNYRANVWALMDLGVDFVIGVNVVGGIAAEFRPGDLAVPEQLIDYTSGRAATFGDIGRGIPHIDFTLPFDPELCGTLRTAAADLGFATHGGVYGVTQGPRLETAAEVRRLARDGCTMVGMTAMPEAGLAREVGLRYAILAASVNDAAGLSTTGTSIHADLAATAGVAVERLFAVISHVAGGLRATV